MWGDKAVSMNLRGSSASRMKQFSQESEQNFRKDVSDRGSVPMEGLKSREHSESLVGGGKQSWVGKHKELQGGQLPHRKRETWLAIVT